MGKPCKALAQRQMLHVIADVNFVLNVAMNHIFPSLVKKKINGLIAVVRRVEMQSGSWKTRRNVFHTEHGKYLFAFCNPSAVKRILYFVIIFADWCRISILGFPRSISKKQFPRVHT